MNRRVRLTVGLGVIGLSDVAAVFISIHDGKERFEASNFRVWLVAVPFEVAAHPEYAPGLGRTACKMRTPTGHSNIFTKQRLTFSL